MSRTLQLPLVPLGSNLPKIIHQTFAKEVPKTLQEAVNNLTMQNSEWEHRLYNNKDVDLFILKNYGKEYQKVYRLISPQYGAARADFFRYLLMYKVGGIYLDLKSSFGRPIDQVISGEESYILAKWRNGAGDVHEGWGLHDDLAEFSGGEFQQWHIIAVPGHPFLREVINVVVNNIVNYDARTSGVGWSGVLKTTGPIAYTKAIAPLVGKYPCTLLDNESHVDLIYSVLSNSGHIKLDKNHYMRKRSPVVFRSGFRGVIDRSKLALRTYGNHLREVIRSYRHKLRRGGIS